MNRPLKLSFENDFYHITPSCNYFSQKEGFFKTFVVLVSKRRKIEKD